MIEIQLNEQEIEQRFREELRKRLDQLEMTRTFWDMKELCRQTCMSETFVKDNFFYDPEFPKRRVGRKWLMPAKATEQYLLEWLSQKPAN